MVVMLSKVGGLGLMIVFLVCVLEDKRVYLVGVEGGVISIFEGVLALVLVVIDGVGVAQEVGLLGFEEVLCLLGVVEVVLVKLL
jgi:hypothetical protein